MKIQQKNIQILLAIPLLISFLLSTPVFSMEIVQNCLNYDYEQIDMCTQCKPGYFISQTQNICIPCPGQCVSCSDAFTCNECQYGQLPSGECILYDLKCKIRLSNDKCEQCFFGYYLSKNNVCLACQNHCSECTTDEYCLQCETGYYLDPDGFCQPCSLGCTICSREEYCLYCNFQHFLSKGQCFPCIENCLICSDAKTCKRCMPLYEYKDKQCREKAQ